MGAGRPNLWRLKAAALERVAKRRFATRLDEPAFSLTFDDAYRSVVRHGVPVLLDHDAKATFYVASGLRPDDGFLDSSDLISLTSQGFDVACHTYSHYNLARGTSRGLATDAARNRSNFENELRIGRPRDFCYPFGEVSLGAKRLVGQAYATARSTYPGVNCVGSDLLLVRANPVFSSSMQWEDLRRLLEIAARQQGWVVFYTHGVAPEPGPLDATPADLDRLLHECRRAGLVSRSVRSVSEELVPDWSPGPTPAV